MHKFHTFSGRRARYHRLCAFASPAAVAVLVAAAPGLALAAEHTLCLLWRVEAIDRTAGSLAETTQLHWPARGTRVQVSHALGGNFIAAGRTTTSDACFTFEEPVDPIVDSVFRDVRVFYDTRVGTPGDGQTEGRVHVRGFFEETEVVNNTDISIVIRNVAFRHQGDGTYKTTVAVGSGADSMSISMASVSHTLHRVDTAMTGNKPATPPLLKVVLQNCLYEPLDKWSCLSGTVPGRLFLTPDEMNGSTKRKFVSAHEAGHWLDHHWGGASSFASTGGTSDYTFGPQNTIEQTCRFTWVDNGGQGNVAHAMRSQEHQTAAVREAFAHFMALFAFNQASATVNPRFQYYKKQDENPVDGSYPAEDHYSNAAITSSGIPIPHDYLSSPQGCDCVGNGNCSGTTTQMQWMRAYWWYLLRDEPGVVKPTLTDFFGQMQATSKSSQVAASCHAFTNRCFAAVTTAIPAGPLRTRWQSVGMTMGLATDAP